MLKIARYWTRGEGQAVDDNGYQIRTEARGWSDESVEDARVRAKGIAQRVAERLAAEGTGERNQYQYGDRPLPEELLRDFRGSAAPAVVTRNAYGSVVLNADKLMFVDIDRKDSPVDSIAKIAARHSLAARVYKTAAGYRALIVNASFEAGSPAAQALLTEFGSDPLYIHLCRRQESFRARLTPKPWRCGTRKPPVEFPFETPQAESQFRKWEAEYNSKTARYATCKFLTAVGPVGSSPEFQELIRYHDQESKAGSDLTLA